ncbi:MAG: PLP-dependent aminotransferase family protein [Nocardioides sp.]|uniref:MocR-like transcription factor YczR n=1 Tax=Nocardioides sp. TaxID=35761 RepID=UPI003F0CCF6B
MAPSLSASRVAALVGDFDRSPAYAGLSDALVLLIGDGRIGIDVRLPSERSLTEALDVSRTTVTRAYAALCEAGYARARHGSGTWTTVPGGRRRAHDRSLLPSTDRRTVIDLNCAAPSAPPGVAAAYAAAVDELPAYLSGTGYFPVGVDRLREEIAQTYVDRGLPTSPDQIMVTPGALAAATVVSRALTRPASRVLVESPTYPNATMALAHAGARLAPLVVDPDGWDVAATTAQIAHAGAQAAYLIPDFQNPTGHLMDDPTRERLAAQLRRAATLPVIDEAHQQLALDPALADAMPAPFAAHCRDAITIGSASKSHWGGLRLGWLRAPQRLMDALLQARVALDLGTPVLEQLALAHLLADPGEVLEHNRTRLRLQRDTLVAAVTKHLPQWRFHHVPRGGLALWCELPGPVGTRLAHAAEDHGVALAPGPVFAVEGGLDRFVRLPWTRPADELEEAVVRIATAWDEVSQGVPRSSTRPGGAAAPPGRVLIA